MTKLRTIQLQVPEGVSDGDSIVFHVNGKEMELPIPHGSKPGDILQIQVTAQEDVADVSSSDTESSSEVTRVQLHKSVGVTLSIYSQLPHDYTSDKIEGGNNSDKAHDEDHRTDDGTHAMPWPAGVYLAKKLSSPLLRQVTIPDVNIVVELGAGTGLCGIAWTATKMATAKTNHSERNGGGTKFQMTLTDVPSAMKLLGYNVQMNSHGQDLQTMVDYVGVKPLTWGEQQDVQNLNLGPVDLILGSDLLYNATSQVFHDLCNTIQAIDCEKRAKILLSVRWRKPEQERQFFEMMEVAGYDFQLFLDEDDLPICCDLDWKEFGNPKCVRSNEFFTDSLVQVNHVLKPLKDIMEDDMDIMTDEEYELFERRFIQIYIGQKRGLR